MEMKITADGKVVPKKTVPEEPTAPAMGVKMLVSGMLKKDGKSFTRVSFMRGNDWAEGLVPDGLIEKSEGFSEEELGQLRDYLVLETDMILEQAKSVNPLKSMFF